MSRAEIRRQVSLLDVALKPQTFSMIVGFTSSESCRLGIPQGFGKWY